MKLSENFFYTLREDLKDEESISGNLLVKSGMFKKVGNGIYMKMPLGKKVAQNVEKIIREDYDNNSKSEINYFYKNGLLSKETLINKGNSTENYDLNYIYNKENKLISTDYKSQEYNETYNYKYKGKSLTKTM